MSTRTSLRPEEKAVVSLLQLEEDRTGGMPVEHIRRYRSSTSAISVELLIVNKKNKRAISKARTDASIQTIISHGV